MSCPMAFATDTCTSPLDVAGTMVLICPLELKKTGVAIPSIVDGSFAQVGAVDRDQHTGGPVERRDIPGGGRDQSLSWDRVSLPKRCARPQQSVTDMFRRSRAPDPGRRQIIGEKTPSEFHGRSPCSGHPSRPQRQDLQSVPQVVASIEQQTAMLESTGSCGASAPTVCQLVVSRRKDVTI